MDPARARAIAEHLHRGQREASGEPVIGHVRRVALAVPRAARAVAWLHEVLEWTSISEEALLAEELSFDELRALRLLTRPVKARSEASYLGHVKLIAGARGTAATLARSVKRADLQDRLRHSQDRAGGWSPPYARALAVLRGTQAPRSERAIAGAEGS